MARVSQFDGAAGRPAWVLKGRVVARILAGVVGGWWFTAGFVVFGIALLLAAGMPYGDARTLAYLLAFLVYLTVFCWAFADRRLGRVWAVLAGGGGLMGLAGWWWAQAAV